MSAEVVIAILGAGGVSAIIAAIVTGLFSKKKLGAEATEIITKAAAGVVTNLQGEVDRQSRAREDAALQHRLDMAAIIEAHDTEMVEVRRVLQLHVAWDTMVKAICHEHGIELPPVPPLLPAQRPERPNLDMPDPAV